MTDDTPRDRRDASDEPIQLGRRRRPPVGAPPLRDEPPPPADPDDYDGASFGYEHDAPESAWEPNERGRPHPPRRRVPWDAGTPDEKAHWQRYPSNVEAEAALLGAFMIDNRLVDQLRTVCPADYFYEPVHYEIYQEILAAVDRGIQANPLTLKTPLEESEALKDLGGPKYLAQLTGSGAALFGARDFAEQLGELWRRRRMLRMVDDANAALQDGRNHGVIGDVMVMIDEAVADATPPSKRRSSKRAGVAAQAALGRIDEMAAGKEPPGFAIDLYQDWNVAHGRFVDGRYTLLGGRPSMGKTAMACTVAAGAASAFARMTVDPGAVEFWLLEGDSDEITNRILATLFYQPGRTSPYSRWTEGGGTRADRARLAAAAEKLAAWPLQINDPAEGLYVEDLRSAIRQRNRVWAKEGRRIRLVILDYLGKMKTRKRFNKLADEITHISSVVAEVAKAENFAVLALAQLSRGLEAREDKRPGLTDLRDSGSLEQDGDHIMFVYRDEYYLERQTTPKKEAQREEYELELSASRDRIELYSSKRRQGALEKRTGYFFAAHQALRSSGFGNDGPDLFNQDRDDEEEFV